MQLYGFTKNTFLEVSDTDPTSGRSSRQFKRSLTWSNLDGILPSAPIASYHLHTDIASSEEAEKVVQDNIRDSPQTPNRNLLRSPSKVSAASHDASTNSGCRRVSVSSFVTGHRLSVISVTDDCYSSDSAEMKNQECSTREVSSARSERCSILDFARENAVPSDNRTTVMIRNIPCRYTQEQLYKEMREYGFLFNFMYLPPARHSPGNLGYAFTNFLCSDAAQRFISEFAGHAFKQQPNSKKRALPCFAELQGFRENVDFYSMMKVSKSKNRPFVDVSMTMDSIQPNSSGTVSVK